MEYFFFALVVIAVLRIMVLLCRRPSGSVPHSGYNPSFYGPGDGLLGDGPADDLSASGRQENPAALPSNVPFPAATSEAFPQNSAPAGSDYGGGRL